MHDVSIPAALIAGLVSFLSPCVLPLVPPYLIYLTGATIEHVANDETTQTSKRAVMTSALMFVLGFSTVFVALGASASLVGGLIRAWSAELSILAGIVIIIMGLHFLGLTRIGLLMREGRMHDAEAGRAVGRLCHGARLRLRLDALHRPHSGGDPVDRGGRGHRHQGRRPARGLFRRASESRSCWQPS